MSDEPIFLQLGVPGEAPPDSEALREQAATALERASQFIDAHGDALARTRTWAVLEARPMEEAVASLAERQCDDGSFPVLVKCPDDLMSGALAGWNAGDALLGTLQALSMLADLRQLISPTVDRAVDFLASVQLQDGSWGSQRSQSDPPDSRLIGTALLTGMLGKTRAVRPDVLGAAANFVAERFSPERVEGGEWGGIAGFASFFTNVHHERGDEALQWCGRELERGFRSQRFQALSVLRVLLSCDAAALPGSSLTPPDLLVALLSEQAKDGGFGELESAGIPARVEPTLGAITAILRLCTALPSQP